MRDCMFVWTDIFVLATKLVPSIGTIASLVVLQGRQIALKKSRPVHIDQQRDWAWIAIEYSDMLGQ